MFMRRHTHTLLLWPHAVLLQAFLIPQHRVSSCSVAAVRAAVFTLRAMIVVPYFEKALYELVRRLAVSDSPVHGQN